MTFIIKIDEINSVLVNYSLKGKKCKKMQVTACTLISTNYTLFRYLLKLLNTNSININKNGYVTLRKEDKTVTSLQQIIIGFYAKYDKNINIKEYEVDHINNEKLDNRITNLQILKHSENIKKTYNSDYNIEISSEYIQELDNKIKNKVQYEKDKRIMQNINNNMLKALNDEKLNYLKECCYFYISSSSISKSISKAKNIRQIIKIVINDINNFLAKKVNNFYNIVEFRNKYIIYNLFNYNLKMLNRYRKQYKYLDEVLSKYKILDMEYNKNRFNLDVENILGKVIYEEEVNYEYLCENFGKSKHILYDLYIKIIQDNYTIKDDNVLSTLTIGFEVDNIGKYKILRIMYLLGLLKRANSNNKMSFFSIPYYTNELIKEANRKAKKILKLKLRKVRFFTVIEEFGEDIAKEVYGERYNYLRSRYEKTSKKVKEIVIDFLKTDEQLRKLGYVTSAEIVEYVETLKDIGKTDIPIYRNFEMFIKDLLRYSTEVKLVMEQNGFEYRVINKSIINNTKNFQKSKNINHTITTGLYSKGYAVILKKLTK